MTQINPDNSFYHPVWNPLLSHLLSEHVQIKLHGNGSLSVVFNIGVKLDLKVRKKCLMC